ncbi:MAG TPA: hypothetical protein VGC76_07700 [Pyrinomonadaceae bacterium]|jgi:hypothetical protein
MEQKQEKDTQPPIQVPREGLRLDQIEGNPQGWDLEDIAGEASQRTDDEIYREGRRGDETEGDADERDTAGSSDSNETPQGREEAKNDVQGKANANG